MAANFTSISELILERLSRVPGVDIGNIGNIGIGSGGGVPTNFGIGSWLANFQRSQTNNTANFSINEAFRDRPIEGYFLRPEAREAILQNRVYSSGLPNSSGDILKGIGIAPPLPPGSGGLI